MLCGLKIRRKKSKCLFRCLDLNYSLVLFSDSANSPQNDFIIGVERDHSNQQISCVAALCWVD